MKYCGKERGSITLFLALILSLLLSLVCTSIESVCMASARTQILNSMDIGLYSVFGQYDRKLLEEYDLFALDGSMGGGQLNLAKICDNLESYMKPVLKQNSQKLELHQSGLTGYRLLTDECGEVFYQQIVQYMQETLGSQGVQLLLNKMSDRERKAEEADLKAKQAEAQHQLAQGFNDLADCGGGHILLPLEVSPEGADNTHKQYGRGQCGDGVDCIRVTHQIGQLRRKNQHGAGAYHTDGQKQAQTDLIDLLHLLAAAQRVGLGDHPADRNGQTGRGDHQQYIINAVGDVKVPEPFGADDPVHGDLVEGTNELYQNGAEGQNSGAL